MKDRSLKFDLPLLSLLFVFLTTTNYYWLSQVNPFPLAPPVSCTGGTWACSTMGVSLDAVRCQPAGVADTRLGF